jgi:hypothetical protein
VLRLGTKGTRRRRPLSVIVMPHHHCPERLAEQNPCLVFTVAVACRLIFIKNYLKFEGFQEFSPFIFN